MIDQVNKANKLVNDELKELGEISAKHGFLLFPCEDKATKSTGEMHAIGMAMSKEYLSKCVVPFLRKRLGIEIVAEGYNFKMKINKVDFEITSTKSSIELDNAYLPTKFEAITPVVSAIGSLLFKEVSETGYFKNSRVFGYGDSPGGSDIGLVAGSMGNFGIYVNPIERPMDSRDHIMETIIKDLKEPTYINLPIFSKDGKKQLAAAEVTSHYQRVLSGGLDTFSVQSDKGYKRFVEALKKSLESAGYILERDTRQSKKDREWVDEAMASNKPYSIDNAPWVTEDEMEKFLTGFEPNKKDTKRSIEKIRQYIELLPNHSG